MIAQAVILAAGKGQRLNGHEVPKPLATVGGRTLLRRTLDALAQHGVLDVGVVVGYRGDEIRAAFAAGHPRVRLTWIENPDYEQPNGVSLLAARFFLRGRALLLMCDHVFCPDVLAPLVRLDPRHDATVLVVDPDVPRCYDLDDATKVRRAGDLVVDIGKQLADYDAIDTGIFVVSPPLLRELARLPAPSLSDGVRRLARRGLVRAHDIDGRLWQDVDTPATRTHTEWLLRAFGQELRGRSPRPNPAPPRRENVSHRQPLLFTPGPLEVPRLVAEYMADPPANYHRQDAFRAMFAENQRDLKELVGIQRPDEWHVTLFASTGTGANDVCLLALARLGRGLIVRNGYFGGRLVAQATENGVPHAVLDLPPEEPVDPWAVDAALAADPGLRWVYFVSHETRAGLVNPLTAIGQVGHRRGVMVAADCVSSAYAYPIDLEAAHIDLATGSSAKAIMAHPGLGMVFTRKAAVQLLRAAGPARGSSLDLVAEHDKQAQTCEPRFGQPVALHAALRAACLHLKEVGVDAHHQRIRRQMQDLVAHLDGLGAPARVDPRHRSWTVCNFDLPPGFTCPEIARFMDTQGLFLLYGIGGDTSHFQISTMGHLADEHLAALKRAFTRLFTSRRATTVDELPRIAAAGGRR